MGFYKSRVSDETLSMISTIQMFDNKSIDHIYYMLTSEDYVIPCCPICNKSNPFWSLDKGYKKTCSYSCAAKLRMKTENEQDKHIRIEKTKMSKKKIPNIIKILHQCRRQISFLKNGNDSSMLAKKAYENLPTDTKNSMSGFKRLTEEQKNKMYQEIKHSKILNESNTNKGSTSYLKRKVNYMNKTEEELINIQHKRMKTLCENNDIQEIYFKLSLNSKKSTYRLYTITHCDREYKVQGYERFYLLFLLDNNIPFLLDDMDIRQKYGSFDYIRRDGKQTFYKPDFVVGNNIVEVKSIYTLYKDDNILLKRKSVIEKGLGYTLIVYDYKGHILYEGDINSERLESILGTKPR